MRFCVYDFEGKGLYLRERLLEAGHEEAALAADGSVDELDLLLVDCDWRWAYPRTQMIEAAARHDARVVLYPHGGRPLAWIYDGLAEPHPSVDLRLEHGPSSITLAGVFGAAGVLRQRATGWLFCPTETFESIERPRRILFVPMHPNIETLGAPTNGHDPAPAQNQRLYRELLALRDVELAVSIVGPAWRSGLWQHPRATFYANPQMLFHNTYGLIKTADVVVATGTAGAAAVALGKPTVMFAQEDASDYIDGAYKEAAHADAYQALVRYPYDADDASLAGLLEQACAREAVDWRRMWVGEDGTAAAIELLEALVGQPEPQHVLIEGATARALTRS